ncbi:hypothetical protein BGX33_000827 [Mortierella sp. NVP41]|nr:hypothetical protein BGX33_000827 [Mortierella sp. NVP41]
MNRPGARNYRSIYEEDCADNLPFENKKGGNTFALDNLYLVNLALQEPLFSRYCNNNNSFAPTTGPGATEELLPTNSLPHYMNFPVDADPAALFARALVYPPQSSNQVMNPIQAVLGPSSFENHVYTTTTATAATATSTTGDSQNHFYGTFDTPYPTTLQHQHVQDPRLLNDQQQPTPYPGFDHQPPTPLWAPSESIVGALYTPLDTLHHHQQQQQQQQQQHSQQYHFNPHTLHYTQHHHHHPKIPLPTGVSPHFINDPPLSPPPPPLTTSPHTEIDDLVSSRSSTLSSSSDEEECYEEEEDETEGPSTPSPTRAVTYPKQPKRRARTSIAITTDSASKKPTKTTKGKAKAPGKLHPCKECGKVFTRACNLQSHITTHLRQKPFSCPDCQLAFARVYDMKRHHRIHSNVRPYQCTACPEAFKRIEARERHFVAHHGYPQHQLHHRQGV